MDVVELLKEAEKMETKNETKLSCLVCNWTGMDTESEWHDLSNFDDDSMCSNQEGSGWWECPECGEACRILE